MFIIQICEGYFSNITKIGLDVFVEVASWLDMGGWDSFLGFPIPCILAYQKCKLLNVRGGPLKALVMCLSKLFVNIWTLEKSMIIMQYARCQDVRRRDDMISESPTWTTSEVFGGLKFEQKMSAFSVKFGKVMTFRPKNVGNWGILFWDQWSQVACQYASGMDDLCITCWTLLQMERKLRDGPLSSMQSIDGKLFWMSSLASLMDPSFWSRGRVCYQIPGGIWAMSGHVSMNDQSSKWFRIDSVNLQRCPSPVLDPKPWSGTA